MDIDRINKTVYRFTECEVIDLLRKTHNIPNKGEVRVTSDHIRSLYLRTGGSPTLVTITVEESK